MNTRTIKRIDTQHGTRYEIDLGNDESVYLGTHEEAVKELRELGLGYHDAEAVVYNAQQSMHPYEF